MKLTARKLFLSLAVLAAFPALADSSFSTLITTPLVIEGLTNDNDGNLYAPGRADPSGNCPVYRVALANPVLTLVGLVPGQGTPTACSPSGLAFGPDGQLYVTETNRIFRFVPNAATPPTATLFASGVPGTNGLAFDRNGNLWTGDGTTGQGRVWKIDAAGVPALMFRVQPMANDQAIPALAISGVGRDARTLGPGTIAITATSRNASNTAGSQPLVANGLQFDARGNVLIADTARGAIWRVELGKDGSVTSPMGCDTTFPADTLCLDNIFVAHPLLEGGDGLVLDVAGNMWVAANERNAIVFVSATGQVSEVFRNPTSPPDQLRNAGPLESPASPVLAGTTFCTSNSDGARRDNFPNTAGEIKPAGPNRGKISCMDQRATIRGARLPVH